MHLTRTLMIALLTATLLSSCSNENEKESKIDTMTKKIGQEAVQAIKTPLDKAQAAADQEEKRIREMEERNSR